MRTFRFGFSVALVAFSFGANAGGGDVHNAWQDPVGLANPISRQQARSEQDAAKSRQDLALEVQRVIRSGTWRCMTNNRGWCDWPQPERTAGQSQSMMALEPSPRR
jgi:hypothetical protein